MRGAFRTRLQRFSPTNSTGVMTLKTNAVALLNTFRRWIRRLNYRYELKPIRKSVHGVTYDSYDLADPPSERLRTVLLSQVDPGDVVYDIGAYYGSYALPLSSAGCVVHAFEPVPHNVRRLRANVDATRPVAGSLTLHPVGISEHNGTRQVYRMSEPAFSSLDHKYAERTSNRVVSVSEIRVWSVDQVVEQERALPPDHIKIDAEGLGPEVLNGAINTLRLARPKVYLEIHPMSQLEARTERLWHLFDALDYTIDTGSNTWICTPN